LVTAPRRSQRIRRKQAAPRLKVTSRAFGMGCRMPIAQKYVDQTTVAPSAEKCTVQESNLQPSD
jgi:hypothetical protein